MASTVTIHAAPRVPQHRAARRLRQAGSLPAVVYGHGIPAQSLAVNTTEFLRCLRVVGASTLLELAIGEQPPLKVLIQDVAHDPVHGAPIHVDFRAVSLTEKITTRIPLRFTGTAPVINAGGVVVRHLDHLEVEALASDLIPEIVVDCTSLVRLESSIHVRDLVIPPGITVRTSAMDAIASVTAIAEEEVAPAATPSVAEVKVVGKEKTAEEGAIEAPNTDTGKAKKDAKKEKKG